MCDVLYEQVSSLSLPVLVANARCMSLSEALLVKNGSVPHYVRLQSC